MTPDFWAAVEDLFAAALELAPADRELLLSCQRPMDADVVAEVEALLAAHDDCRDFLEATTILTPAALPLLAPTPSAYASTARAPTQSTKEGRLVGHYRLQERIGVGGMGEVYRAADLALGGEAALKLLPAGVEPALRRAQLSEADASSRLQHPAIATFYEAGEADGEAFIAMELVPGETLRARLARGPLPVGEAVALAVSILEALGHAHAAGVLHRDVKPENVMLTPGGATKLLDFGIARLLFAAVPDAAGASNCGGTQTTFAGTPGYLAPEQVLGQALDCRTDIYQVGVVLCEAIGGRRPFPGDDQFERMVAVLSRPPDLRGLHEAAAPAKLTDCIERALARNPADRFPDASAFLRELRPFAAGAATASPTIAVLDLQNDGGPDDAWLASGIADDLASDLARAQGLTLVPRDRVHRTVRDVARAGAVGPGDPLHVGRLLGSRWLLTGSFQRCDDRLDLTLVLLDVPSAEHVSTQRSEGDLTDLAALRQRLCRQVLRPLDLRLPGGSAQRSGSPRHPVAFESYARGYRLWRRLEKGTLDQARQHYERAIAIDPEYAEALCGLAAVYAMQYIFTTDARQLESAAGFARRAIASDESLAEPHVWLGYVLWREGRLADALVEEERAMQMEPANAFAPYFAGCIHQFAGNPGSAAPLLQRAIQLQPGFAFPWMVLAASHTSLGELPLAKWCLERAIALERDPSSVPTAGAGAYLAELLRLEGRLEDARRTCLAALDHAERSDHMYRDAFRGIALCCLGRTAWAQGDRSGSQAAFGQAVAQLRGRERTLAGGHLLVQAMAGLALACAEPDTLDDAIRLFQTRDRFNFAAATLCDDATTLTNLGRAAVGLGCRHEARGLLCRARNLGSHEAGLILQTLD